MVCVITRPASHGKPVEGLTLCSEPGVRIVVEHLLRDMARYAHDGGIGRLRFCQFRYRVMADVMKPQSRKAGCLGKTSPGRAPAFLWLTRIDVPILAGKEEIIIRLRTAHRLRPTVHRHYHDHGIGVQRNEAMARLSFTMPDGDRVVDQIHIAPLNSLELAA